MFTDIKGFTQRTSSSTRDAMTKMMNDHARLLVPVFDYFDGTVVKTIGDAYLVYFSSPTDAVLCGVTIQEVLRQHNKDLSDDERLEIRVAINVGDVELMDSDVMGEPVNIAARLEGIAEAGQVYFTEAVYQTMNRKEAPSAEVGEHIFKGIPHPIRVYKVIDEPDTQLAKRLAECVSLNDNGPVIDGIREVLVKQEQEKKKPTRPKYIYAMAFVIFVVIVSLMLLPSERDKHMHTAQLLEAEADYINALNMIEPDIRNDPTDEELRSMSIKLATSHINKLVQQGALQEAHNWLVEALKERSYLQTLRPQLAVLDARRVVKNDPTGNRYTEFYDLAHRYPSDTEGLYTAAKLLEESKYFTYMTVWLYREALKRGAYQDDISIFEHSLTVLKNVKHYASLEAAHDIIENYFSEEALSWSKQALSEGSAAEVMHAYLVLENLSDPVVEANYYRALNNLVQGKELDSVFKEISTVADKNKQKHIIKLEQELVETYPRFFIYSDTKDKIEEHRQQLIAKWNFN